MFDFEKPKIEIAEISEDKKYGRFVGERYTFYPFDLPPYANEYVRSLRLTFCF